MKIIGQSKNSWICEMTSDEIASLQGCDHTYSTKYIRPEVGKILNVSSNWGQYLKVNMIIDHKQTLIKHCEKMIAIANDLKIEGLRYEEE